MPKSRKKEKQEDKADQELTTTRRGGSSTLISSLSSSPPSEPIDMKSVFPSSKIKSMLRQEEQIGRVYSSAVDLLGASSAFFIKLFTDSIIAIAKKNNPHNDGVDNDVVENTTTTIASTSSSQSSKIKKTTQTTLITAEHILQCMSKDSENGNKYDFIRDVVTSIVTTEEGSLKPTKVRERKSNENNYSDSTEITNKSSNRKKSTKNEITAQLIVQVPNYSQLQNKKGNADDNRTTNTSRKQKRKSNTAKDFKQKKSKVTKDIGLGQYLNSNELSEEQIDKMNEASDKFYDDEEIIEDEEEYD